MRKNRSFILFSWLSWLLRLGGAVILLLGGSLRQPAFAGVTEVVPITTGHFQANIKNMVDGGVDRRVEIPIPVYLIRHTTKGIILFDAGLGTEFDRQVKRSWLNHLLQLPLPYHLTEEETALRAIERLGIGRDAVRTIIVSHLHSDHAGGLRDFPRATVIVSQREWEAADVGRFRARLRGYMKEQLEGIRPRLGLVNYSPASSWGPFEASYDLFGDGSLVLLSTPGHTRGHQSLLITMDSGRKILLAGDTVWVKAGFERPAPKPWLIRHLEEWDDETAWESTLVIHQFSKDHPEVLIVPGHDPDLWPLLLQLLREKD